MFTGIIQDIGKITTMKNQGDNVVISVQSKLVDASMLIGDSVAIGGVCLTVTTLDLTSRQFTVTAVEETLRKTTLGRLRSGSEVNLEPALRPSDRLGGHFVQGHVDSVGKCERIDVRDGSWLTTIAIDERFRELVVDKGSIAIDGVSLTAYEVSNAAFTVSIIPHTLEATTMKSLKAGDLVNIEFDILGKYVQRMVNKTSESGLSIERLKNYGF